MRSSLSGRPISGRLYNKALESEKSAGINDDLAETAAKVRTGDRRDGEEAQRLSLTAARKESCSGRSKEPIEELNKYLDQNKDR